MKKKHFLLVIISMFCQFSLAQQNTSSIPSVSSFFTEVGKNANIVSPIYDMEGKKTIDMDLLSQQDKTYHDGIMTLTGKSKIAFMDTNGNLLSGGFKWDYTKYNRIPKFHNGYTIASITRTDALGNRHDDQYIVNKQGKTTKITALGAIYEIGDFNEDGIAAVTIPGSGKAWREHTAFINTKGLPVYRSLWRECHFGFIGELGPFRNGLARFHDAKTSKSGYVNKMGKIIIPVIYEDTSDFSEGYAVVRTQVEGTHKYIFIDTTGKQIIPRTFSRKPTPFVHGYSVVQKTDDSYVMMDKQGNIKTQSFKALSTFYDNGRAFAEDSKGVLILNEKFEMITRLEGYLYNFGDINLPLVTTDGLFVLNDKLYDFNGNFYKIERYSTYTGDWGLANHGRLYAEFGDSYHNRHYGMIDIKTGKMIFYFKPTL